MRALVLALGLMAAPAAAAELKPFDFMGFVAGEAIAPDRLKKCGKGGDVSCLEPMVKVSNVYVGYLLKTHDYKLSTLYIDAHPNSYSDLLAAFTLKYGEPCEKTVEPWQNAMGAKFDNPTFHWCFKSGRLLFAKYGARIDKMAVFYEDANKQQEPGATVNF